MRDLKGSDMNDTNTEGRLRAEIDDLKQRLEEQNKLLAGREPKRARPSVGALVLLGLLIAGLILAGIFAGYLPRQRREEVLAAESKAGAQTLPVVNVVKVTRSDSRRELILPGNIQAVTEGPVLARTSGYLKRRLVDIGDRVKPAPGGD
jgi:multidrug efflux pump subunit AcrA (membrane-fusion protein)